MLKVDTVLCKLDNVHFHLACIVLTAVDKLPVVDSRLGRQPIRRRALLCRLVDHDHAIVVSRLPVPVIYRPVPGIGAGADLAASTYLPAVKRTLQPVPRDLTMG